MTGSPEDREPSNGEGEPSQTSISNLKAAGENVGDAQWRMYEIWLALSERQRTQENPTATPIHPDEVPEILEAMENLTQAMQIFCMEIEFDSTNAPEL